VSGFGTAKFGMLMAAFTADRSVAGDWPRPWVLPLSTGSATFGNRGKLNRSKTSKYSSSFGAGVFALVGW